MQRFYTDRTPGTNPRVQPLALFAPVLFALWISLVASRPVDAAIYLNEITTQPSTQARVEIYNSGPGTVDLTGWSIQGDRGRTYLQGIAPLPPGGRAVIGSLGDIFEPIGGLAGIIDDLERPIDGVHYGVVGGAPAPPALSMLGSVSLCRSPDASHDPAPPQNPIVDASFWTLDLTPTFGIANDVPNPNLGQSLCINEMMADPSRTLSQAIELCGPSTFTGGGTNLNGWFVTTAFGVQFLSGTVPSSGLLGVALNANMQLADAYRIDLFDPTGRRVYQKSSWTAPEPRATCYGDCPDHSAPADGWDYLTCGGGVTFFPLVCSIGSSNAPAGICAKYDPTHGEDPIDPDPDGGPRDEDPQDEDGKGKSAHPADGAQPEIQRESWGALKARMSRYHERQR